jgi:CBS domain-containing protein
MAGLFVLFGVWRIFNADVFNGIWFILIAMFLFSAATTTFRAARGASLPPNTPVKKVMRFNVPIVEPNWPLAILAWRYLDHARDQAFPVMDNGALVGMITAIEADKIPRLEWGRVRVEQTMLPRERLAIVAPDDDLTTVMAALESKGMNHAPVFDNDQFVGMLNRRDIVYRT